MNAPDPQLSFCGLQIYIERRNTRVTGRVEFPYEMYERSQVSIDYRSCRPDIRSRESVPSHNLFPNRAREEAAPNKARLRLEREGQREEEIRHNRLEWLETGDDGLARWWRSIPQSRASARPPV